MYFFAGRRSSILKPWIMDEEEEEEEEEGGGGWS
jgi:hypothetical protein